MRLIFVEISRIRKINLMYRLLITLRVHLIEILTMDIKITNKPFSLTQFDVFPVSDFSDLVSIG
jgi:hypothetical protein